MKIGDKVKIHDYFDSEGKKKYNNKEYVVIKYDERWKNYWLKCDELDEVLVITDTVMDRIIYDMKHPNEIPYQPKHAKEQNPVAGLFCAMANIDEKVLVHRSVCNKLNDIYEQKNEKYGDSFGISVKKYGLIAALTRISDKFNRFEQLVLDGSNGTDDESLLDTCLDTANYFIMTAMELKEKSEN